MSNPEPFIIDEEGTYQGQVTSQADLVNDRISNVEHEIAEESGDTIAAKVGELRKDIEALWVIAYLLIVAVLGLGGLALFLALR